MTNTKVLTDALQKIAEWELPATGKFWDEEKKEPMSYGAAYGSNGERDYMKSVASAALASYAAPPAATEALSDLSAMMDHIMANEIPWNIAEDMQERYDRVKAALEAQVTGIADAAPPIDLNEHPDQALFDQYSDIKKKIGELGYLSFISSKEVEEYREWLRNNRYKHRLEWFEKEYPNSLYSKDEDGNLFGINILTKKFLAEADAAEIQDPYLRGYMDGMNRKLEGQVTGKSAGVFVNAGIRVPSHDEMLHVKIDGIRRLGNFYCEGGKDFFYVAGHSNWIIPKSKFGGIEWLDESGEAGKLPEQQPAAFEILRELVDLKKMSDAGEKVNEYLERKPKVWEAAFRLIDGSAQGDVSGEQKGGSHE